MKESAEMTLSGTMDTGDYHRGGGWWGRRTAKEGGRDSSRLSQSQQSVSGQVTGSGHSPMVLSAETLPTTPPTTAHSPPHSTILPHLFRRLL